MKVQHHCDVYAEYPDALLGGVVVAVDHDYPNSPYINLVQYICPDTLDDADIHSHFERLEIALSDLNGAHVPHLEIHCGMHKTASAVSRLLLEGRIFPQYLGELRKVSLCPHDDRRSFRWTPILPDEILSTPTHSTLNGITVELSTAQRVEWLLRKDEYDPNWRNRYLLDLLEAARASATTLPEAGVGVSAQTEKDEGLGRQVGEDGEEMEEDELDAVKTRRSRKTLRTTSLEGTGAAGCRG